MVTDRTQADVERWKTLRDKGWASMTAEERLEWLGQASVSPNAAKGMYTHKDLNRVETTVEALADRFKTLGYDPGNIVTKTDWEHTDAFWVVDMQRYYSNISAIRATIPVFPQTPKSPYIGERLTHTTANNIEKILEDVDILIQNIQKTWHYAGEVFMGEV